MKRRNGKTASVVAGAVRWLAAIGVLAAFGAGLPVLLWMAPSPIDSERGVWSIVEGLINNTQVFEEAVISLLVALGWVLWAYLFVAFLVEVIAAIAGRVVRVRGFGFGRRLVGPVISALMWSTTATSLAVSVVGGGALTMVTSEPAAAQPVSIDGPTDYGYDGSDEHRFIVGIDKETVMVNGAVAKPHVVVEKADTMWDLADKHLGDAFRWTEIADLNVGVAQPDTPTVTDADLIWPGTVLLMPADATGLTVPDAEAIEALCTPTGESEATSTNEVVEVVRGDTMWDLAEEHLDDPFRWTDIADLNVGVDQQASPTVTDPDLIWPGTVLELPAEPDPDHGEDPGDCEPEPVEEEAAEETTETAAIPATSTASTLPTPTAESAQVVGETDQIDARRPWWMLAAAGAAAAVFAAAMMKLVAKRRNRAAALGEETDESLEAFEDLGPADRELRDHLLAASASLAHWETTVAATFLQVDSDRTTALFLSIVKPPTGCPWTFAGEDEDGLCTWWLDHDVATAGGGSQALYGIGENLFLNLEAIGSIGIESGDEELALGLLRRLVFDVAANFGDAHDLIVRTGAVGEVEELDALGITASSSVNMMAGEINAIVSEIDRAHSKANTVLMSELRDDDAPTPTMIYVIDEREALRLCEEIDLVTETPGRYPICFVIYGASSGAPWVARIENDNELVLQSPYLKLSPRVAPEVMGRQAARDMAIALGTCFDGDGLFEVEVEAEAAPGPVDVDDMDALGAAAAARRANGGELHVVDEAERARLNDDQHEQDDDDLGAEDVEYRADEIGDELYKEHEDEADEAEMVVWRTDEDESVEDEVDEGESDDDDTGQNGGGKATRAVVDEVDVESESDMAPDMGGLVTRQGDGDAPLLENPVGDGAKVYPSPAPEPVNPAISASDLAAFRIGGSEAAAFVAATKADVGVRLLGEISIAADGLSPTAVATVAYLVVEGGSSERSKLRDAIWHGRQVSDRRLREVLKELRATYGPRFSDMAGKVSLDVISDADAISATVQRTATAPWDETRASIIEVLELASGEPFGSAAGRWWDWVDRYGDQTRRAVTKQVCGALEVVCERARLEGDWDTAGVVAEAGLRVSPVSQKLAEAAALAALAGDDVAKAMAVVDTWESVFEALFDEDAPDTLRALVRVGMRKTA